MDGEAAGGAPAAGMRRSVPMGGIVLGLGKAPSIPGSPAGSSAPRERCGPAGGAHPQSPGRVRGALPGHGNGALERPDAMETEVGVGVSIPGSVPGEFWVWNGRKFVFCLWGAWLLAGLSVLARFFLFNDPDMTLTTSCRI